MLTRFEMVVFNTYINCIFRYLFINLLSYNIHANIVVGKKKKEKKMNICEFNPTLAYQ